MKRDPAPRRAYRLNTIEASVIRRRTLGFLNHGTHLPIEHILAEAYLQGMRDALDVLDARGSA